MTGSWEAARAVCSTSSNREEFSYTPQFGYSGYDEVARINQKGGEVGARRFSLISSCRAIDINPEAYLVDVIAAIDTTPASMIAVLTPWAWAEQQAD